MTDKITKTVLYPLEVQFDDGGIYHIEKPSKAVVQMMFDKGFVYATDREAISHLSGAPLRLRDKYPTALIMNSKYAGKCALCGKLYRSGEEIRCIKPGNDKWLVWHAHCWINS